MSAVRYPESTPSFNDVESHEPMSPEIGAELAALRAKYLVSQDVYVKVQDWTLKLSEIHLKLPKIKRQLVAAHAESQVLHAQKVKESGRRRSSVSKLFGHKQRKEVNLDEDETPEAMKFRLAFENERDLDRQVKEMEEESVRLDQHLPAMREKASSVEADWNNLNARYSSLRLISGSENGLKIQRLEQRLEEATQRVNDSNELFTRSDRARHCLVSAYLHMQTAMRFTEMNQDTGVFNSMYPDPMKPVQLARATEAAFKAEVCLQEARGVLDASQLPRSLELVRTDHAATIGSLKYIGISSGNVLMTGGTDLHSRVAALTQAQRLSFKNLETACVEIQDAVNDLKAEIVEEEVAKAQARQDLEVERSIAVGA